MSVEETCVAAAVFRHCVSCLAQGTSSFSQPIRSLEQARLGADCDWLMSQCKLLWNFPSLLNDTRLKAALLKFIKNNLKLV